MTDKPAESAVERYYAQRDAIRLDQGPTYGVLEARADDAIAELKARIEELSNCENCPLCAIQAKRADEAEAALAKVLEPKPFPQCPNKQCADWARLTSKNRDGWDERARKAEAKLAAAEAALYYDEDGDTAQTWQTRAEGLEAKLAEAKEQLRLANIDCFNTEAELAEAKAEEEALKCCGNCRHWSDFDLCAVGGHDNFMGNDYCHFTPSRWTDRKQDR